MSEPPLTKESVLQLLKSGAEELVREETATLFGTGLSSEQWAYLQAAAVLSYFNPAELLPVGDFPTATSQARTPLLANSRIVPGREGLSRWILSTGARKEILHRLGTPEALHMALSANTARSADPLQAMLERCISGEPLNLEELSQEELAAMLQVIEWLGDILPDLADRAKVQQAYARTELLAPFRYLAGKNFFDRQEQIKRLEDFVRLPVPATPGKTSLKPLLIYAAGGMGKSALLSKFILDHATELHPGSRLPFVYLDLDRSELLPEEPLTLLAEAIGQLGVQSTIFEKQAENLRKRILRFLAEHKENYRLVETKDGRRVSEHFRSAEARSIFTTAWESRSGFIAEFAELFYKWGLFDRPLLFVLDTFEEVQYLSQDFVNEIWEFLDELAMRIPGLRPVVAGRAAVTAPRVGKKSVELQELPLPPFDDKAAMDYLALQGVADSRLAAAIVRQVKGNPLSLRLAAAVVLREEVKPSDVDDLTAYLQSLGVAEKLIQGQLYKRILSHIHGDDNRVKAIAHPGLVLRRVTPDLILKVLAQPCGIEVPDEETARELFDELAREVSLVKQEDGALVHRSDIRRMMLELLRQDEPFKALQIDSLAVSYYKNKPGAKNRAEEIYHMLQLGKPTDEIDERWIEGVEPYLRAAVEEVPFNLRHYLAGRVGGTGDQYVWDEAGIAEWERYAKQRAKDLVSLGKKEDALRVLAEREERTPQSTLFRLEAQILEQLERWPEARRTAKEGILWATRSNNNPVLLDLLLLAARVDEKLGHFEQAAEMLSAAESLEMPLDASTQDMLAFEICVQRLRLKRMAPASVAMSASDLEAKALEKFDKTVYVGLRQRPDLILSFIEEVGVAHPEILGRVLSLIHRVEALDESEQQALASALAAWDLQLAGDNVNEAGPLASALGITQDIDLRRSWLAFVESKSVEALLAALQSLARQFTPTPDVVRAIVQILKSKAPSTRGRRLTGELFDEVRTALFTIFDNRQALAGMVADMLHMDLEQIAEAELYMDVLYNLVEWAEDNDRMEDLISAALERAPKEAKPVLAELLIGLQEASPQPDEVPIPGAREEEPAISSDLATFKQRDPSIDPPPGTIRSGEGALVRPEMVYNWAERMREAARAVCRVETRESMATGFLVAPNLLLTAAFVIIDKDGKDVSARPGAIRFRFDYQHKQDGVAVKEGTVHTLAEDWLVDYELDPDANGSEFTMVRLEGTPGSDLVPGEGVLRGWLDLEPDHDFQADEPFFVLGHYKGRPIQVECLSLYKLPTQDDNILTFSNPTGIIGPGAAGAPCFNTTWKVLGLRYASRLEDQQRQKGKLIIDCSPIRKIVKRPRVAQALKEALRAASTTEYRPQFYPGSTSVGINRRKHMSGNFEKLRDIPEADVVAIMGHRAPGADYSSTHPPLIEIGEPDCPIRQIVEPTAGAAAGDRVRYSQWTDSMYFAPSIPYWRSYWAAINCKGCDPGTLSGRQIIEARERDIEAYTKKQYDSEMTDVALCSMRGCTVHGHSLRLEENGMQFDMLARTEMGKDGNVYAIKDQVGILLDKKVNLGKPMSEAEAKKRTTIFRVDGIPMCGKVGSRKYDEAVEALHHMWELRSKWGFRPDNGLGHQ